jgi:hypothetical protein
VTGPGAPAAAYSLAKRPTRVFQRWIMPSANDQDALPRRARARVVGAMLKAGAAVE